MKYTITPTHLESPPGAGSTVAGPPDPNGERLLALLEQTQRLMVLMEQTQRLLVLMEQTQRLLALLVHTQLWLVYQEILLLSTEILLLLALSMWRHRNFSTQLSHDMYWHDSRVQFRKAGLKKSWWSRNPELDDAVLGWFKEMRNPSSKCKPLSLSRTHIQGFQILKLRTVGFAIGENAALLAQAFVYLKRRAFRDKLQRFNPSNIFNMDETGLFFRALPTRTYVCREEGQRKAIRGTKALRAKDRLTLFLCVNTTGTCKIGPLLVGTAKNPHCFRDCQSPINYVNQRNAWVDRDIYRGIITTLKTLYKREMLSLFAVAYEKFEELQELAKKFTLDTNNLEKLDSFGIIDLTEFIQKEGVLNGEKMVKRWLYLQSDPEVIAAQEEETFNEINETFDLSTLNEQDAISMIMDVDIPPPSPPPTAFTLAFRRNN
ncbi:hypothetical protein DAPPUDRAFT_116600 [Daphnia pulex]|uniref:DDE-1 domain-containing protein n=1 Tax=Daphnia pulex TaxID=6669 RepID=E9HPV4_DAPPU|nr:hypothetical protein DAPPUDRAFT_116600 [Daphnia pulex]|eukprot:EFX66236.1 hypothetical protein DAPPUDRAFT_116600 [Daphnia pulex]